MRYTRPKLPPIAMLHYIGNADEDILLKNWFLSHDSFVQLLNLLQKENYQTVCFSDFAETKTVKKKSGKEIILSFDDCSKHLFDFAIPELTRRGMRAVFFVPAAEIGGYNSWDHVKGAMRIELMNAGELKQLSEMGMEIGSHSYHHIRLREIAYKDLRDELVRSKAIIESIIQKPVYSFAYPFGSVPKNHKAILSEVGYQYGVSIYKGFQNRLSLRRFGVYNKDTIQSLTFKLSYRYKWLRSIYDLTKKAE